MTRFRILLFSLATTAVSLLLFLFVDRQLAIGYLGLSGAWLALHLSVRRDE
jgi:hypothetical protein